jgi:hypothetical protein
MYYVNFYDSFDGWGTLGFFTERIFHDFESAKICCDEKMKNLDTNNKKFGEHFSVIDMNTMKEIYRGT